MSQDILQACQSFLGGQIYQRQTFYFFLRELFVMKTRKFREGMDGRILSNSTSAPYALHVTSAPAVRLAMKV